MNALLAGLIGPGVRPQEDIRVVLADEVLVAEDEGVAAARLARQGGADPDLLGVDASVHVVGAAVGRLAVGRDELIEEHEARIIVVERVAQAVQQLGAGAAEVRRPRHVCRPLPRVCG